MASVENVKIWAFDNTPSVISCSENMNAEELCILLCKMHKIPPLTRMLLALRIKGTDDFLQENCAVLSSTREYELRIRFKVPSVGRLLQLDEATFDLYYKQSRNDVNMGFVPDIKYTEHKKELLGLGITDMFRAILEDNVTQSDVVKNYTKYMPKIIAKKHHRQAKKSAAKFLPKLYANRKMHDINYIKSQYLQHLHNIAPNYLSEEFRNVVWLNGSECIAVELQVTPFHSQQPGLRMYNLQNSEWIHLCTIEELVYMTRKDTNCVEISRRGPPLSLEFKSRWQLSTFMSSCDGYYRLMAKWIFNLSRDDFTPSLKMLHKMKCHGPIGGAFSYRKLEEKRAYKHGSYILRQCQDDYDVYYLDVCDKKCSPRTYKILFKNEFYLFEGERYDDITDIVRSFQDPDGEIYLNDCLPPSEYDQSQLLLCVEKPRTAVRIEQDDLNEILKDSHNARWINTKNIMIYAGSEKIGTSGVTSTHKALWKLDETRKIVVAYKTLLNKNVKDHLNDFIELANKWASLRSSSIVRLYGFTLYSPTAMVLEHLPYGPFDEYLRNNRSSIDINHLKKVAANLAWALWNLTEAGVVHGLIRCRRLLLASCSEDNIVAKLSGPSLRVYKDEDKPWIPVEFFSDPSLAKRSVEGDIWAFATTLWEIFSYGQSPNNASPVFTAQNTESARLPKPEDCPEEVWHLIKQCWHSDPHKRTRPQEIMRDMNCMLYTAYSRVYETVPDIKHRRHSSGSSSLSNVDSSCKSYGTSEFSIDVQSLQDGVANGRTFDTVSTVLLTSSRADSPDTQWRLEPSFMKPVISNNKSYLVLIEKEIGAGHYGKVYKGLMETENCESQRIDVAVKKLKRVEDTLYEDFTNELRIMMALQHPNIVRILGSWEHENEVGIVMEYLPQGSLNHYLKFQGDKLRHSHLIKFALDIASGMDHVSAKTIVHRDLAARNVLVVNANHVKITDFGLARVIPKTEDAYKIQSNRRLPMDWCSPEAALPPHLFSSKSDVWSYGITVWEIFTRSQQDVPKFDTSQPTLRAQSFPIPPDCPSEVYRYLMKDCWQLNPSDRPTFTNLAHLCNTLLESLR